MPPRPAPVFGPVSRAAAVAAAATLGVLAGFGARDGMPLVVLESAGLRLRGVQVKRYGVMLVCCEQYLPVLRWPFRSTGELFRCFD